MRLFSEMTVEQRATFEAIPRVHDDAGEELHRLAVEFRNKAPQLNYADALERVMLSRPDLAEQHVNLE